MTHKLLPSITLVTALVLAGCATQDRRPDRPERGDRAERPDRGARQSGTFIQPSALLFADMDTNSDKAISKSELNAGIATQWASFDKAPSAAYLSKWSIENLGSMDAKPTFLSFDKDFNGVVSEAEFAGQLTAEFETMDKDRNGLLTRAEMIVAFEAPMGRAQQGGQRGKGEKRGGGRGQGGGGGRPPR